MIQLTLCLDSKQVNTVKTYLKHLKPFLHYTTTLCKYLMFVTIHDVHPDVTLHSVAAPQFANVIFVGCCALIN